MFSDYLAFGGVEIANSTRLNAYLGPDGVGSPLTSFGACVCPTLSAEVLDDEPYTNPADDMAPWYDPDVPASAEFAGFMVLSVEGLDENPVRRTYTTAVTGGASIGPRRVQPRVITVTGILLGSTCCGVEYGLHWLGEALAGCTDGACDGDCLITFSCCPGEDDLTPEEFNDQYRRTVRRVALVDGPRVLDRQGTGCKAGECTLGADIIRVEFVLVAGTPWLWTDTMPVLEVPAAPDVEDECPTFCIVDRGGEPGDGCDGCCRLGSCPDPVLSSTDAACQLPTPPPSPQAPDSCYCLPLAATRVCYEIDLTDRPDWSVDVPMIIVRAGILPVTRMTISFYERTSAHEGLTCDEISDSDRCDAHSVYQVQHVPAGTALTIDGQIERAVVECGDVCETSPYVFGQNGAPPTFKPLDCATYCVCIETDSDNPPGSDALVTIGLSGRGL
ncbi:hypothetical protein [Streptomyces sp. G1]|uniref:hypothetical protein n=1 Tax=Streptomyces sp. G1 TaxID=361572 RepID=UPI00202EC2B5|nr:hypothetical protein [Streptomyces sp. G1]MCM1964828.1 hypothetical protein [Streptomyces sp. G1]